ncbi:hypothetical protein ACFVT9_29065 [Kitasatospora cineracea]|uniref:hypothetical protein n=1 Tax=Kitasatospora cineracea TaxID=88074 RepID=UPI0036DEB953
MFEDEHGSDPDVREVTDAVTLLCGSRSKDGEGVDVVLHLLRENIADLGSVDDLAAIAEEFSLALFALCRLRAGGTAARHNGVIEGLDALIARVTGIRDASVRRAAPPLPPTPGPYEAWATGEGQAPPDERP